MVWSEPFRFNEGTPGVTAALALRRTDTGQLRGVFTTDFTLSQITEYLTDLSRGRSEVRSPFYAVLSRRGNAIASVSGAGPVWAQANLHAALEAAPRDLEELPLDVPVPFTFVSQGVTYSAQLRAFPVVGGLEWIVLAAVPRDEFLEVVYANRRVALVLGLVLLLAAIGVGAVIADRIALAAAAGRGRPAARRRAGFDDGARAALVRPRDGRRGRRRRSDEGEPALVRALRPRSSRPRATARAGREAELGGEVRRAHPSTSRTSPASPASPSRWRRTRWWRTWASTWEAMTAIIQEHHGVVDKFVGDGIMALFNAPRPLPEHAAAACLAALRSQQTFALPSGSAGGRTDGLRCAPGSGSTL